MLNESSHFTIMTEYPNKELVTLLDDTVTSSSQMNANTETDKPETETFKTSDSYLAEATTFMFESHTNATANFNDVKTEEETTQSTAMYTSEFTLNETDFSNDISPTVETSENKDMTSATQSGPLRNETADSYDYTLSNSSETSEGTQSTGTTQITVSGEQASNLSKPTSSQVTTASPKSISSEGTIASTLPSATTHETISSCTTFTTEGNAEGAPCVFPFIYFNVSRPKCIRSIGHSASWCATTSNFDTDQLWGYCNGTCILIY